MKWSTVCLVVLLFCGVAGLSSWMFFNNTKQSHIFPTLVTPVNLEQPFSENWLGLCPENHIQRIMHFYAYVKSDIVLHKWYKDFNWAKARMIKAHTTDLVYVNYRKDNTIYWTQKPIQLFPQETLITDGARTIRSHCCNEISYTKKTPVQENDPPTYLLQPYFLNDWPELNHYIEPEIFIMETKENIEVDTIGKYGYPVLTNTLEVVPYPVPEPSTFILFSSGGFFLWLWKLFFK